MKEQSANKEVSTVRKTLYIAVLDIGQEALLISPLYASSTVEAMEEIISLETLNGGKCTLLKEYIGGFKVVISELPGVIEVADGASN
jgi:hypothetical protein